MCWTVGQTSSSVCLHICMLSHMWLKHHWTNQTTVKVFAYYFLAPVTKGEQHMICWLPSAYVTSSWASNCILYRRCLDFGPWLPTVDPAEAFSRGQTPPVAHSICCFQWRSYYTRWLLKQHTRLSNTNCKFRLEYGFFWILRVQRYIVSRYTAIRKV